LHLVASKMVHHVGVSDPVLQVDENPYDRPNRRGPKLRQVRAGPPRAGEHVAQAPAVIGHPRAEHHRCRSRPAETAPTPCDRGWQFLLGQPVVEGRQAEGRDVTVGAGELARAPAGQLVGTSSSSGTNPIATDRPPSGDHRANTGESGACPLASTSRMCGLLTSRAAVVLGDRQPDVNVDAHRFGDLGAQVLTDGAGR